MLILVGNMNDKSGISANPGAASRLPATAPLPGEKAIRGSRRPGSFVKGISIQTAKYQENNFKRRFIVQR